MYMVFVPLPYFFISIWKIKFENLILKMVTPNVLNPFTTYIIVAFPATNWHTNVVNNSITFQETTLSTLMFVPLMP